MDIDENKVRQLEALEAKPTQRNLGNRISLMMQIMHVSSVKCGRERIGDERVYNAETIKTAPLNDLKTAYSDVVIGYEEVVACGV